MYKYMKILYLNFKLSNEKAQFATCEHEIKHDIKPNIIILRACVPFDNIPPLEVNQMWIPLLKFFLLLPKIYWRSRLIIPWQLSIFCWSGVALPTRYRVCFGEQSVLPNRINASTWEQAVCSVPFTSNTENERYDHKAAVLFRKYNMSCICHSGSGDGCWY